MNLLYHGPLWRGSTSLQRLNAFAALDGIEAVGLDTGARMGRLSIWNRIRWRLRWPADVFMENRALNEKVRDARPDVVIVDNSRVINRRTIGDLRRAGVRRVVYYSPDDIVSRHNLSMPLKLSLPHWDVVFTTKTFNIPELKALGAGNPTLVGKAFDPEMHFPLQRTDVGAEFEKFDAVFVGSYEKERCDTMNALARAGFNLVVYGADKGGWRKEHVHSSITLREAVFAGDYSVAWHTGKVALCFLKKINRDRITQRTMEIAAMGRPMLAEKTDEHDQHFEDGREYVGFRDDADLVTRLRGLLAKDEERLAMGRAARQRCLRSGYSTLDRAKQMISAIEDVSR